jgi:DNA-entry nuclease
MKLLNKKIISSFVVVIAAGIAFVVNQSQQQPSIPTTSTDLGTTKVEQKPLKYIGKHQMVMHQRDSLGRAVDSHIQLKNSQEPKVKRAPSLTYDPPGWHNFKFYYPGGGTKKAWLMNRGHLVGYQFCGLNDEPKNLVAETAWFNAGNYIGMDQSNQASMLHYENKLDSWLANHPHYYLDYQVTPLYKGNELMPRGIRLAYVGYDSKGKKLKIKLGSPREVAGKDETTIVTLANSSPNAKINYVLGTATNTVGKNDSRPVTQPSSTTPSSSSVPSTNSNRTVYVASHGNSKVYWYKKSDMPSNTNLKNVVKMTEKQALKDGKHHSKDEK